MNEEAKALAAVQNERAWRPLMAIYEVAVRLPRYTRNPSVNSAHSTADAARILHKVMPPLTVAEHQALANVHLDMMATALTSWATIVNLACLETFGRPYQFSDYRVSGVARDEFTMERKEQLRLLSRAETRHRNAARAHDALAKRGAAPRRQSGEAKWDAAVTALAA
ncbi:hypothetical protein [Paraburkholderia youngii]|uniref:hypothetical protein n=1 Tax=Paraburkholderia youngii TaxID=2782701 RepID=UPI003D2421D9